MSTPDAASVESTAADPPRARSRKRVAIVAVVAAALVGGGGYAFMAGLLPFGTQPAAAERAPTPALVLEPGSTAEHPRYKTSYLKIEGAFTTNLRNSSRFVQIEIGVATPYDPIVLAHVQTHDLPIRSAVLGVLADQSEQSVQSSAGRARLQRELVAAINHVLVAKEGFGGVSDVYLTGLVVQ